MRKMKRWAALLCAVLMVVTLLPAQVWAAETDDPGTLYRVYPDEYNSSSHVEELSETEAAELPTISWENQTSLKPDSSNTAYFNMITVARYGRSKLEEMENSKVYLAIYDALLLLVSANCKKELLMPEDQNISRNDAELAINAFYADYPELFWARPTYYYYKDKNGTELCAGIVFVYNSYYDDLEENRQKFLKAAKEILTGMPSGSDYEKELYLHDALVKRVTYTESMVKEQNGYTAMVDGKGVCAGYVFTLQYLLMRAGIQSYYVVGDTGTGKNGTPYYHAWNMVKIDGSWYYVDATWDDPLKEGSDDPYSPYHGYFNVTAEMLQEDHTIYGQPENVLLESCTATDAFYYRKNNTCVSTEDSGLVNKVAYLLKNNNGRAYLYVTDNNLGTTAWQWYKDNIKGIVSAMGVSGDYKYNYSCQYYNHEVVLLFEGKYHLGDLNGSSEIDILDVQLLYQYLTTGQCSSTITETQFLANADVNQDDSIDVYDLQLLYETVCNGN